MRRGGENIAVMTAACRAGTYVSARGWGPAGLLPLTSLSWPDIPSDEISQVARPANSQLSYQCFYFPSPSLRAMNYARTPPPGRDRYVSSIKLAQGTICTFTPAYGREVARRHLFSSG